jgi:diacylglycerol kinase (ATP)
MISFINRRMVQTLCYSVRGFKFAFQHEEAFRVELLALGVLVPLALWLGDSALDRVLLIAPCLMVLIMELFNSAVEAVVDLCSPEQHPLAAAAKDMGSAAVLVSLCFVPLTWLAVLW